MGGSLVESAQLRSYIFSTSYFELKDKSQILLSMIPIIRIVGKGQRARNISCATGRVEYGIAAQPTYPEIQ